VKRVLKGPAQADGQVKYMTDVGFDSIAVHVPKLYVNLLEDFARARKMEPMKLKKGLGVERMAIPDRHEDAATLGANAALKLIRNSGIEPKDIGRIYVGTESSVDESKNMGGYIVGMLEKVFGDGSFEHVGSVEFKFACIGTTYAFETALNWVRAGENEGKAAIVISSDIARYDLDSAGEYTQGAGAIAVLVKEDPRLLVIEPRLTGSYTKDENDFYRPFGKKTAVVNGKHSNACYLNAMKSAMVSYSEKFVLKGIGDVNREVAVSDHIDHMIFHLPFPRMAEYAGAFIFRHEWRDLTRWGNIEAEIGKEPTRDDFEAIEEFHLADYKFRKDFVKTAQFDHAYKSKIEPSLMASKQVGNIYTGSMYLAFCSMMDEHKHAGKDLTGTRVGFGSYGSGCSSIVFSGILKEGWTDTVNNMNLRGMLESRRQLSMIEYEALHQGSANHSVIEPTDEFILEEVDDMGYRHYRFVE